MTRILLYSMEPVLAQGLESVLSQNGGFDLLPSCPTVELLIEQIAASQPDVVLVDLNSEVTFAVLNSLKPQMAVCNVILWVNSISTELAFQAMGLGVRGILRKALPPELQIKCLQKVHGGELWFEKGLTDTFLSARRISLTPREGQLISLLAQGLKNKEIATALKISEGTVKVYFSRLFVKLDVKDRFELALFGLKNLAHGQLPVKEIGEGTGLMSGLRSFVMERRIDSPAPIRS